MEKQLVLDFEEVNLGWNGKPSEISLRISLQSVVKVLGYKGSASFAVKSGAEELKMHVLVQAGNIAMASVTHRLSALFQGPKESFEKTFELNVPGNVVKILLPGVNASKFIKVKLAGRYVKAKAEEKGKKEGKKGKVAAKNDEDKKPEQTAEETKYEVAEGVVFDIDEIQSFTEAKSEEVEEIDKNAEPASREERPAEVLVQSNRVNSPASPRTPPVSLDIKPVQEKKLRSPAETPSNSLSKLHLSKANVKTKCSYIGKVKLSEFYYHDTERNLHELRNSMGATFNKFIQESIRRDRVVSRKPTIQASSPRKANDASQMSFVSTKQEDNSIEIAGGFEILVEKITVKNSSQLLCILVALLSKLTYHENINEEIKLLRESNPKQQEHIDTIKSSLGESKEELSQAIKEPQDVISEISQRIQEKRNSLAEKKQGRSVVDHEKAEKLERLKDIRLENAKIKLESDPGGKISEIIELRKGIDEIELKRNHLHESFRELSDQRNIEFSQITAEQIRFAEAKASLLRLAKEKDQEREKLARQNWNLSKQISKLSSISEICSYFEELSLETTTAIAHIQENIQSISDSAFNFRSSSNDTSKSLQSLYSLIDSRIKSYRSQEDSLRSDLSKASSVLLKLSSDIKRSGTKSDECNSLIKAYQQLDSRFESLKYKLEHSREIKDQVINELCYFSDFIFAMSQTFLYESRITSKIKAIVEETDFNVQAMRESLAHIKIKNPVYQPIKADIIDKSLADYLNSRNKVLPLPFVREAYGIYFFGTRKVNISIERNKLMVKVGGGFLPIDEFIDSYTDIELEKFEKRHQEVTPSMKKLMAKWVGGLAGDPDKSRGNIREALVAAAKVHKYSPAYAVMELSPNRKDESHIIRADTPVIGED